MESPSDPEEFGDIVRIQVNLLRIIQEFRFGFNIEPAENQVLDFIGRWFISLFNPSESA